MHCMSDRKCWENDLAKKEKSYSFPQVVVNGEDLSDYRRYSQSMFDVLATYGCPVERLGLDENFVDVSSIVDKKLEDEQEVVPGFVFGDSKPCSCGCERRLKAAARIAEEMRGRILDEVGITCSGGISTNKLLSKLGGSVNKPNKQTMVRPGAATQLLSRLKSCRGIPGIGWAMADTLRKKLGIESVSDLRDAEAPSLKKHFPVETVTRIKNLSFGIDDSVVKSSGKPQTIGLEDRELFLFLSLYLILRPFV